MWESGWESSGSAPVTGQRDEEAGAERVAVDGGDGRAVEGQERGQGLQPK